MTLRTVCLLAAAAMAGAAAREQPASERITDGDPADVLAVSRQTIDDDRVFALVNFSGPAIGDIVAYARSQRVPVMFPHTALVSSEGERYLFTSFPWVTAGTIAGLSERGQLLQVDCIRGAFDDSEAANERAGDLHHEAVRDQHVDLPVLRLRRPFLVRGEPANRDAAHGRAARGRSTRLQELTKLRQHVTIGNISRV